MSLLDPLAKGLLEKLSPSGALVAVAERNYELDKLIDRFDQDEIAIRHLGEDSLVARLEDDFARCVPALADAAVPLESWAIPLLSALAGPCAPLLSFGMTVACKLAILALQAWAKKRLAGKS